MFDSRAGQFEDVLQENVIVTLRRGGGANKPVVVTASSSIRDLATPRTLEVPQDLLVKPNDKQSVIRIPVSAEDLAVLNEIDSRPHRLRDFGLDVSTGPVVPFRAKERLADSQGEDTIPLLWMQHVRDGKTTWPIPGFRKAQHLRASGPDKLTVEAGNYVLMRRFSAKEEARRLNVAPLLRRQFAGPLIGLENHLNYIHRAGGSLAEEEANELARLLNSEIYDRYFRILSGNTQVSSTEIRELPLPDLSVERSMAESEPRPHQSTLALGIGA